MLMAGWSRHRGGARARLFSLGSATIARPRAAISCVARAAATGALAVGARAGTKPRSTPIPLAASDVRAGCPRSTPVSVRPAEGSPPAWACAIGAASSTGIPLNVTVARTAGTARFMPGVSSPQLSATQAPSKKWRRAASRYLGARGIWQRTQPGCVRGRTPPTVRGSTLVGMPRVRRLLLDLLTAISGGVRRPGRDDGQPPAAVHRRRRRPGLPAAADRVPCPDPGAGHRLRAADHHPLPRRAGRRQGPDGRDRRKTASEEELAELFDAFDVTAVYDKPTRTLEIAAMITPERRARVEAAADNALAPPA